MNLYFRFRQPADRRHFVRTLLVGEIPKRGLMKKRLDAVLDLIEGKRHENPFYHMERKMDLYGIPEWNPANPAAVLSAETLFLRGIRSIHSQKSYRGEPGFWLVLSLRDTKVGRLLFESLKNQADDTVPQDISFGRLPWHPIRYPSQTEEWEAIFRYAQLLLAYNKPFEAMELLLFLYYQTPWFFLRDERVFLWEELAFEFEAQDHLVEAESCLRIQSSLQPDSVDPFLNLGTFHLWREEFAEAMHIFLEGLTRNPTDEYLQYNLATVYSMWGEEEAVLRCLDLAILRNSDSSVLWKLKGDLFFDLEEFKEAKRSYQKALHMGLGSWPDLQVSAWNNLGLVEARLGEVDQAVASLERALQLDAGNIDCLMNLSSVLGREAGDFEKAQRTAKRAVKLEPSNARARHNLGLTLMQGNVLPEAEWHLRKARQLDPQYRAVRDALAECVRRRRGL